MKSSKQLNNRESSIGNCLAVVDSVTSHPVTRNNSNLLIGNTNVLIRTSHSPNTHMCVELYHMGHTNEWVKSWGLDTGDVEWLVHLSENGTVHNWFNLPKLRTHIANMLAKGEYQLVNNPNVRDRNRPNTNVMNVWVPLTLSAHRWDNSLLAVERYATFIDKLGNGYGA